MRPRLSVGLHVASSCAVTNVKKKLVQYECVCVGGCGWGKKGANAYGGHARKPFSARGTENNHASKMKGPDEEVGYRQVFYY